MLQKKSIVYSIQDSTADLRGLTTRDGVKNVSVDYESSKACCIYSIDKQVICNYLYWLKRTHFALRIEARIDSETLKSSQKKQQSWKTKKCFLFLFFSGEWKYCIESFLFAIMSSECSSH